MSQIILKFDLPEEQQEANWAIKGYDYLSVLTELDQELRQMLKHDMIKFKTPREALQWVRDFINEGVDLYE